MKTIHATMICIKKITRSLLWLLNYIGSWFLVPTYAYFNNMTVYIVFKKPIAAMGHRGILNGQKESENTLIIITNFLDSRNIEYFVNQTGTYTKSVCIMLGDRRKAIECLLKNKSPLKGYYYKLIKTNFNTNVDKLIGASILPSRTIDSILAVEIFRHIKGSRQRAVIGHDYRVTLEFWSRPEDLTKRLKDKAMTEAGLIDETGLRDSIIAPTSNNIARVVSGPDKKFVPITIGSRRYKTLAIFNKKQLSRVDFPIDIVYTWVDGSDPEWLRSFTKAKKEHDPSYVHNSAARYSDNDELKYSLRSVEMYAPWVNKIYIVTAGQRPSWLKTDDKLKVVDHKDIFSDTSALPVFNSHAIESQLHHIVGLTENYIYLNDDILFARPTRPEDFFFSNGIAKIQTSSATIGTGKPSKYESAPSSAGKNARKIIEKKYGFYLTNKYRHTVYPQKRSVAQMIEQENKEIVDLTMRSKFRSPNNIPFTSTLMQSYLQASGNGVKSLYPAKTINVSSPDSGYELKNLLKSNCDITFCLEETDTDEEETTIVSKRIKKFLEKYYSFKSRWEI